MVAEPWPHRGCPALMRRDGTRKTYLIYFFEEGASRELGARKVGVAGHGTRVSCRQAWPMQGPVYAQWEVDLE